MKPTILREITLYRYRYILGYLAFGGLLLALLLFAIGQAPRGLSQAEMDSTAMSVTINIFKPTVTNVIDAPYHLLQKASIQYLGLTPIAIKLPSIVIGALTGVAIVLMLQKWFRKNVAIITALIIVTSVGFLSLARLGTPMIMTAFWTVILLLGATHVLHAERHRFGWKLFCFIAIALLAYSPFGVYPLLVMVLAGVFHPHVRHRLKQGKWWQHLIAGAVVLLIVTPLIFAVIHTPAVARALLGSEGVLFTSPAELMAHVVQVIRNLFDFTRSNNGLITTPLFGLATTALLILGLLKLFTASYSARSYMLFIWIVILIPILVLRPDMILLVIIPGTLILAIGIETLIRQWYDLFPRNPYARIAALIPLSILLISIISINMERYFYGHHYSPLSSSFHAELPALRDQLDTRKWGTTQPVTVSVPARQVGFYDLLRREYPKLVVNSDPTNSTRPVIVFDSARPQLPAVLPTRIITSDLSRDDQAVLLRSYAP